MKNKQELLLPPIRDLFSLKKRNPTVIIEGGWLSFMDNDDYEIEMSRIKTNRDILAWVRHLANKSWITTEMISDFVEVCAVYRKIDLQLPQ